MGMRRDHCARFPCQGARIAIRARDTMSCVWRSARDRRPTSPHRLTIRKVIGPAGRDQFTKAELRLWERGIYSACPLAFGPRDTPPKAPIKCDQTWITQHDISA